MFEDQLSPIWYNVWLDPNLRNKTMNLPLELSSAVTVLLCLY